MALPENRQNLKFCNYLVSEEWKCPHPGNKKFITKEVINGEDYSHEYRRHKANIRL
jgi:hypothetical protein